MEVIPVINCSDFTCVKERITQAKPLGAPFIHFDISDIAFSDTTTWNNPDELTNLELRTLAGQADNQQLGIELHLMVQNPKEVLERWKHHDVRRVLVHIDNVTREEFDLIVEHSELNNIEVVPAVMVGASLRRLFRYIEEFRFKSVAVLAVPPGHSGQKFNEVALETISLIRAQFPKISISVDGGINPDTAKRAKAAGANTVVTASYIWGSKDSQTSIEELRSI